MPPQLTRVSAIISALAALACIAAWYALGMPVHGSLADFVGGVLESREQVRASLTLLSLTPAGAALLCLLTLLKGGKTEYIHHLGTGLGWWALGNAYITVGAALPVFAAQPALGLATDIVGNVAAFELVLIATYAFIRFWVTFPRPVAIEALDEFREEELRRLTRVPFAARVVAWFGAGGIGLRLRSLRTVTTPTPLQRGVAILIAGLCGLAWFGVSKEPSNDVGVLLMEPAVMFLSFSVVLPAALAYAVCRYHRAFGTAEDRRRVEWFETSVLLGAFAYIVATLVPVLIALLLAVGSDWDPALYRFGNSDWPLEMFIYGTNLVPLLALGAFAISVLYLGTVDPRLALKGVTVWTVMGVILTLVFALVERSVALRLAVWLGLPPQTGFVVAGGVIAATFQPIRKRVEKHVNRFVERALPASMLASGTAHTGAIALVDISGYTALAARDEVAARLASALVQKEARRLADEHQGRVVKNTGDGVLMCFLQAQAALDAVAALHTAVVEAAAAVKLDELKLHSGLHWGEYVEVHDGDIYGQSVNLTARIADWAQAGEIGMSEAFHDQLQSKPDGFRPMGPQSFKNVPQPVTCLKLAGV